MTKYSRYMFYKIGSKRQIVWQITIFEYKRIKILHRESALNFFQLVFRQWVELHRSRTKSISFSARNPLILSTK